VASVVALLGDDATQIPVKTAKNEIGILDVNENGELVVSQILQSQEIEVGERLFSAGLDQQVPPDLYLGEVNSVSNDERASTKSAVVARPINLQTLQRVFILDVT
jgi:cell shape-determining protein MreC